LFGLVQHHKYSISELENIYPFERDIYYGMLVTYLEEQQQAERVR